MQSNDLQGEPPVTRSWWCVYCWLTEFGETTYLKITELWLLDLEGVDHAFLCPYARAGCLTGKAVGVNHKPLVKCRKSAVTIARGNSRRTGRQVPPLHLRVNTLQGYRVVGNILIAFTGKFESWLKG